MHNRDASPIPAVVVVAVFATALIAGLVASAPALATSECEIAGQDRFAHAEGELRETYAAIRDGLAMIPTHDFDVPVRQRAIGEAPEALFDWVRDNTNWVAYRGVLRGPRGTLMDGYGSHADRALLLAALLESAGHEARIARAELPRDKVDRLVARLPTAARAAPKRKVPDDSDSDFDAAAARLGVTTEEIQDRVRQADRRAQNLQQRVVRRVETQSRALIDRLDFSSTVDADDGRLAASLADHWWVQVRIDNEWQDLDPAWPDHRAGDRLADGVSDTFWPEDVPDDSIHELTVEIVAEQLAGGRLREHTALTRSMAAPDLLGRTVTVDLHPMDLPGPEALLGGMQGNEPSRFPERVRAQDDWMPLITAGGAPEYDKRILADGRVVAMAATAQAEALEEASGMLGGILADRRGGDESASSPELTAVFLRLTVRAPGADPVEHERTLMDVLGPARRAGAIGDFALTDAQRAARAVGMLSSTEILAQGNWWPVSYTMGHLLDGALKNRKAALGAVHAVRRDSAALMGKAIESLSASGIELIALAHHRHARSPHRDAIVLTRLNLLSTIERMDLVDGEPAVTRGFDIIDNRIEVRTREGDDARRVRLGQGVLDTVLEAELMRAGAAARNTSIEFARALEAGSDWRVVDAADLPDGLDADVAAYVSQALAAGDWVVMPENGGVSDRPGWWRIDPATGSTLGMGPDGRGQMTEQILTLMNSIDNAVSAVATVQAIWNCILTRPSPSGMQCCIVKTGLDVAAGNALGKLSDRWGEIASAAIDSKIYLAALDSVFGEANGIIVDGLMPDPCG